MSCMRAGPGRWPVAVRRLCCRRHPHLPPPLLLQAGAGISPIGGVAMLASALMDLVLPRLGVKAGPVWGAGGARGFRV